MNCKICRGACCEEFSTELAMFPPKPASWDDARYWFTLHATKVEAARFTFECRCTKLTSEGRCSIYEDRPLICELFIPGSIECLETVRRRRTPEEFTLIASSDNEP